jgi:hypothetical protein
MRKKQEYGGLILHLCWQSLLPLCDGCQSPSFNAFLPYILKCGKNDAPKELSYRTYYRHKHLSMLKFLVLSAAAGTISHPLDAPPPLTCADY